ncbi:MAG TPA: uroporphyrinogen decarboxylase [Chitinophagaceae bacterium]|nr:uroporphyrinogen decarboxylase [Chitinophagaceae bacterium]
MNNFIKNDLLLRALAGANVERPPVWMMRQAGRYLPAYMELKRKYDFFTRVQTPELVAAITKQPIDIVGSDAAILFSDILVVPQAMGLEVQMNEGVGPLLPNPIKTINDFNRIQIPDVANALAYVFEGIRCTKQALNNEVPLIGFAGAPFTILCYMVEGKGSKTFEKAKQFCYQEPQLAHRLLNMITITTINYLEQQVIAGVDALQIFDSWSGLLSPEDFAVWSEPYLLRIYQALVAKVPVIIYPKGSWYALTSLSNAGVKALGIDWCISPAQARSFTVRNTVLQGNFDPAKLLLPIPQLKQAVTAMIDDFGVQHYIANLGHGITPNIPVANAKAFIEAVKNYKQ